MLVRRNYNKIVYPRGVGSVVSAVVKSLKEMNTVLKV